MSALTSLQRAVTAVYDAALGGLDWREALSVCAAAVGAGTLLLAGATALDPEPVLALSSARDAPGRKQYAAHYLALDRARAHAAAHLYNPMSSLAYAASRPEAVPPTCPACRSGGHHLVARLLARGPLRVVAGFVADNTAVHDESPADEQFTALIPHLRCAVDVAVRLQGPDQYLPDPCSPLETAPLGYAWLDARGRLLHANAAALAVFCAGDALSASSLGLRALRAGDDAHLQATLRAALTAPRRARAVADRLLAFPRFGNPRPYSLRVSPLRRCGTFAPLQPAVRVIIGNPDYRPAVAPTCLEQIFGLTPREAELAVHLLQGEPLNQAAQHMCITTGSLRQHLHRVFRKIGVCSQAELVATLLVSGLALPPPSALAHSF